MKILLIEDDKNLCEMLRFQLEKEHHDVEICMDGRDGLDLVLQDAYDLILLDRMLPTMNGLLVLQKARNKGISTPVIMITALGELYDRVEGLDCGADDYLVKPFAYEELSARIRSIGRRNHVYDDNNRFSYADITYDSRLRELTGPKGGIQLSGREGRLLEVLEKSPLETREPACQEFPACGGCMYQTMSYEAQKEMKECQVRELLDGAVRESLAKIGKNGDGTEEAEAADHLYHWDGIYGSPIEFGYRNKMEFSFGDEYKDGPLSLGLHKKGSTYDILNTDDCKLVHPDMTKILVCVREFFLERNASFYKKLQHVGYLRHLLLRRGVTSGEILVHVVTTTQEEYDLEPLKEQLLALPLEGKIVGIMHILNDSLSDVVQSDETKILYGKDYFYEELLGLKFKISTFSFFQPNSLAAEILYSKVREYVGDTRDKVVFDLYSGTGTIAQLAASVASEVIGVEIVEDAVKAARENAALNGINNCRFIAGDVLKVLDEVPEKPDMIILDPPRDGVHPKALPKILAYGVDQIVYISCKVTSLVRDLPAFYEAGYEMTHACAVDQFCQGVHVETIALLSRKNK